MACAKYLRPFRAAFANYNLATSFQQKTEKGEKCVREQGRQREHEEERPRGKDRGKETVRVTQRQRTIMRERDKEREREKRLCSSGLITV